MSGTTKRAYIYSPYFHTAGGGEVYALTVAEQLTRLGFQVVLAANPHDVAAATSLLSINTTDMEIDPQLGSTLSTGTLYQRYRATANFDLGFFVSDGSIPFVFAKKNLLHFQVPFLSLKASVLTATKLLNQTLVFNSRFTENVVTRQLKKPGQLLYPPLRETITAQPKHTLIVSVGRFGAALNSKQQESLIDAFALLHQSTAASEYRLVLIGTATSAEAESQIQALRSQAEGLPIEILPNCTKATKNEYISKARFYWHAAGMGKDPAATPEIVEHFGIAIVEAMSAGCVPVVANVGGPVEILSPVNSSLLVESVETMVTTTLRLIEDEGATSLLSKACQRRSTDFALDAFMAKLKELV